MNQAKFVNYVLKPSIFKSIILFFLNTLKQSFVDKSSNPLIIKQGSTMMEIDIKMGQIESITEIVTVRPEKSHPLCTSDGLNMCDMSKAITMNSRNNKISPLEYLDQKSVTNIGKLRMSCEESL